MTLESAAAMKPALNAAAPVPESPIRLSAAERREVAPSFCSPYTTRYMPSEKITIDQGASFSTFPAGTTRFFRERRRRMAADASVTAEIGIRRKDDAKQKTS